MVEWAAKYLKDATEQDPEVTEWDDAATRKRKLERAAKRKAR